MVFKKLKRSETYKNGEYDGPYEKYYEDGQLSVKITWKDGERDGLYKSYYKDGQLDKKETYKNGRIVN